MNHNPSLHVLQQAIESSVTGVVIADATRVEMPLTYVNQAFVDMTGYSKEFSIGKNCRFLQGDDTDPRELNKLRNAIKAGESCKVILKNYRKDGSPFWNELSISPIIEEDKLIGFVGIQDDISQRIEVEKKLQQAKIKAEASSKSKADFLNVISHELRTPLTIMLGNLPLLTDAEDMPATEEIVEIAQDIEESGKHLLTLINELLDISRIEEGRLELHLIPLSVSNCIEEAVSMIKPLIEKKGLYLKTEIEDFNFIGDTLRIKQILLNLLGNARKFTDEGGITISSSISGNIGSIVISDTGCGIQDEYKEQIFEVFKQADSSVARAASGSGLGLAITQKLLELHGGKIEVKSQYGSGSDFIINLPLLNV